MTDLAKAIERVRRDLAAYDQNGQLTHAIRTVCDAAERASRVSVEDVARKMYATWPTVAVSPALANKFDVEIGEKIDYDAIIEMGGNHNGLLRLATAVMALFQGEG